MRITKFRFSTAAGSRHFLVLVCLGFFLVGCSSPAEVNNMTVDQSALVASVKGSPFPASLSVKTVNGGEETNPMWTSEVSNDGFRGALEGSLQKSGLAAAPDKDARFDITASLSQLEQPIFGLDFKVTSQVNYRVVERKTEKTWYDQSIIASYTATFGDAVIAIQRLRFANEGAIRENVKQFIESLMAVFEPKE